jgi:hypothetical protein
LDKDEFRDFIIDVLGYDLSWDDGGAPLGGTQDRRRTGVKYGRRVARKLSRFANTTVRQNTMAVEGRRAPW